MKNMRWLLLAGVIAIAIGCGSAPATKPPAASKARPPSVKPPAAEPPPPTVAAAAYPNSTEAVAAFAQAVAGDNAEEYGKAQSWLRLQGTTAIPAVAELVQDEQAPLLARTSGCKILAQLGPEAAQSLLDSSQAGTPRVRQVAIEQLGNIRPVDQQVVVRLTELTQGTEHDIRLSAITGLFNIGPPAKDSADALLAILNSADEPESLRQAAKSCLKRVNPRKTFND